MGDVMPSAVVFEQSGYIIPGIPYQQFIIHKPITPDTTFRISITTNCE